MEKKSVTNMIALWLKRTYAFDDRCDGEQDIGLVA